MRQKRTAKLGEKCLVGKIFRYGPASVYSEITVKRMPAFKMARYVIISPNPEDDVNGYMRSQGERGDLLQNHPDAMFISWDFPFVSRELRSRFGLRGYADSYKYLLEYLGANGYQEKPMEQVVDCYEHVYEKEGMTYMQIYLRCSKKGKDRKVKRERQYRQAKRDLPFFFRENEKSPRWQRKILIGSDTIESAENEKGKEEHRFFRWNKT